MSEYIHKSHNVSVSVLYHIVCPTKYRRVVINADIEDTIKGTCNGIAERFEINFLEIGIEGDHVHFLVQSVPSYSPAKIVTTIKGNISRQVFEKHPEVKKQLWAVSFGAMDILLARLANTGMKTQ